MKVIFLDFNFYHFQFKNVYQLTYQNSLRVKSANLGDQKRAARRDLKLTD